MIGREEELRRRARALEAELRLVQEELVGLGETVVLGPHLDVDAAGFRCLVPVAAVREVVWLVELAPTTGAPPFVRGSFAYRGESCLALDLAHRLGGPRELPLEAKMLVLAEPRGLAVVVDRVTGLVEAPRLSAIGPGPTPPLEAGPRPPFAGLSDHDGALVPVLDPAALAHELPPDLR